MNTRVTRTTRRIMITGGTGLIGRHLCDQLLARGDEVVILSRHPEHTPHINRAAAVLPWQPGADGPWARELDGIDAVVNLAGAPFFTRWKANYYHEQVIASRQAATDSLLNAMKTKPKRPAVFINGSSIGVYGYRRDDKPVTEATPPGDDFWGRDSIALEQRAAAAKQAGARVVQLRTGIVLARESGALGDQLEQFRKGWGAIILPGSQWFPWIHVDDVAALIAFAIDTPDLDGALNATAPHPIQYRDYAQTLARSVGSSARLRLPGWIMRRAIGPVATTVTHGRRVIPAKATDAGFRFRYPTLETALGALLADDSATGRKPAGQPPT